LHARNYIVAAARRELKAVASAPQGQHNDQLNRSAFALFRFVETDQIPAGNLQAELIRAARAAGLSEPEARATIRSAAQARRAS
jgi:hypothetical protein